MSRIYRVTPKDPTPLIDEKIKYVVVKNGKVKILDNKNYIPDLTHDFTFEVGKSHAKYFQKYIENNLENFKKDFPAKFIELLKEFDIQESQQEQSEFYQGKLQDQENNLEIVALNDKKEQLKQHVLQSLSSNTTPVQDRRNSVRYESIPESISLRKAPSFHDLPNENSPKITRPEISIDLSSSQNSIPSQDSEEQASLIVSAQKICLFFTQEKHNNNLFKMERHGSHIKNGYFNGSEKSKILLEITTLAAQIRDASNAVKNAPSNELTDNLKQKVLKLNDKINDNQKLELLSRYRGISQSIARFFGYGNVTSIECVNQLRNEFNPLINEVLSARPTA